MHEQSTSTTMASTRKPFSATIVSKLLVFRAGKILGKKGLPLSLSHCKSDCYRTMRMATEEEISPFTILVTQTQMVWMQPARPWVNLISPLLRAIMSLPQIAPIRRRRKSSVSHSAKLNFLIAPLRLRRSTPIQSGTLFRKQLSK